MKRVVASVIVILAACYGFMLLFQGWSETGTAHKGRAIADTVQLAFGEKRFLKSYSRYQGLGSEPIKHECTKRSSDIGHACYLATPYPAFFHKGCNWLQFENCVAIRADSLFLRNPALMAGLSDVLHSPCSYLPNEQDIQDEQVDKYDAVSLYEFKSHRSTLGCDKPQTNSMRIVVVFGTDSEDGRIINILARVGEAYE